MPRSTQTAAVAGRTLTFSNLEKVLWPRDGYTKGDLIAYYRSVARWLIPHLRDRPLTLQRWPDGIDEPSFFEKKAPRFTPDWIPTVSLAADENSRKVAYLLCNDEAALAWCANLAAIALHVWYSRVPTTDSPDYALFDLDTCERTTTGTLASVALAFRES
ncbi:MAG: non-homologous end-joining DNA ligase LigD, partial [Vulcanimicrobiaceae bacterium]